MSGTLQKLNSLVLKPTPAELKHPVRLLRDPLKPLDRHLLPDTEGALPGTAISGRLRPGDSGVGAIFGPALPRVRWSSVVLFFNLIEPRRPSDYLETTSA